MQICILQAKCVFYVFNVYVVPLATSSDLSLQMWTGIKLFIKKKPWMDRVLLTDAITQSGPFFFSVT